MIIRNIHQIFLKFLILGFISLSVNSVCSQTISANLSFSLKSGPVFPVDANSCGVQLPTAHFVAVEAYNSSASVSVNVGTLTLDSIPTNWTIKGPLNGINKIGVLASGQRKTVYFYLRAKCAAGGTAHKFRFKAQNSSTYQYYRPTITLETVITAASGSSLLSKISTARVLGGYVKDTVTYEFASFRTGYHMIFSPTSQMSFKYNSLNLESSEVISAASGLGVTAGTKDILYFSAGSNASGSSAYPLTVVYIWRIVGLNDTILIAPFVCGEQGGTAGNIKGIRSDTTLLTGKKIIVPISANNISVTKTCASAKYSPGDTVTFDIKLTNSSSTDIVVDEIRDTLSSGMSFVRLANGTDFTANMMSLMPAASATGALRFLAGVTDNSSGVTSMTIPGNSSKTLKIRVFIQTGTSGSLTNKSAAYISATRLDTGYAFIQEFGSPVLSTVSTTNVTCNGGTNGQIKLTANAATRPFTWSKDGTNYVSDSTFSGLSAGTYTCYVKSNTGKISSISVTITQPAATAITGTASACVGSTTTLTGSGTAATSNPWTSATTSVATVSSSGVVSGVAAGTSVITYTDNNGCSATQTVTINSLPSVSVSPTSATIISGNSQSLTAANASSYSWSPSTGLSSTSGTTVSASPTSTTTYIVTGTDANGCTNTATSTITVLSSLSGGVISGNQTICQGNDPTAFTNTTSASGGTGSLSIQWQKSTNSGATWTDISGATNNTYDETASITLTTSYRRKVTDGSSNIEYSNTLTITVNSKPDISLSTTSVGCFGGNNGSINTTISSGTSPFTYGWTATSYTASTKDISSLTAKTYTLIVTDNNSCKDTASANVTEPAAVLSLSNSSQTNVLCFGNTTGAVTVSASGGTSPYEYKIGAGSYSSSATFSTLAAGSYTVTAKDANGCTQTLSVTITQPAAALSIASPSITNVGCKGAYTGAVSLTISGGTTAYSYAWTGPSSYSATTKDISSLAAGTYSVTVTDANGCSASNASVSVTEPAAVLSLSNSSQTNVLCFGNTTGAVTVSASGGTSPYEYKIGAGSYSSSATFSTLAAGSYTVTAKDANGCTQTLSVTITQPAAAISVTAVASTNISCNAGTDGSIIITATGGSTKKYSINNGSTFQSSNVFTGLAAGTYTIVVSDNNSCSGSFASGVSASVTLTQPNAISVTAVASTNPSCKTANDGSITITANGGNTLSYSIDNGATYQSSNIFTGLGIGSYTVKVRDSKSCSVSYGSVNTTITLTNGDITKPTVQTKNYNAYLNNSGVITISYGNINNGSTDNCEINAIYLDDSTFDCTNIGDNTVTLTVTDIAGNTDTKTATVTVYDTISPTPKAKNLVVYLDATGNVSITAAQANNGSTDNCSIKTLSLSKSNFSCADTGVNNSIKFAATDYSNNTAYTFFNVRVYDTISPTPKAKNLVVYLDATGNVSITAAQANKGSTDNCSIKTLSLSKSNFSCADTGVNNSIKFTATDYSSNTAYTFFNVRVYDTISPTPKTKNLVMYLDATGNVSITAADADNGSTDNCSIKSLSLSKSNFSCTDTGVNNSIKFTATDYSQNTAYTFFNVRVYDTISPTPKAKNLVVYLDATGNVSITAAQANNGSTDNCSINTLNLSNSNFSCADTGVYNIVKFTATDYSQNTAYTFFTVRVYDTISPQAKVNDFVIYLNTTGTADIVNQAFKNDKSTDNCSIKRWTLSMKTLTCADTGVNNAIKLTITDRSNNTDYTYCNVRVYDTISPTPRAQDLVVYLDASGNASITAAQVDNGSTDNCSIKTLSLSKSNFSCADTGVNKGIVFTATDYSNNKAYALFNVTVLDTIKPTIVLKTAIVYLDTAARASLTRAMFTVSSNDNCGVIDTTLSRYNVTLADTGWTDIDVWVTDKNNNTTGPIRTKVLVLMADTDNDSIPDYIEGSKDFDGDGVFDYADMDSDNDGILDVIENEGKDSLIDLDKDGKPNYKDLDTDNDGIDDVIEVSGSDPDFNGIAGNGAAVVDANGVPTIATGGYKEVFTDSDSQPDYKDLDADDDGIIDNIEKGSTNNPVDTDVDGTGDWRDLDSDNDGISDKTETDIDTDGDGTGDWRDLDSDNDSISDKIETTVDTDGDGTGDWRDLDSDNDGISDKIETDIDTDGDGVGDWRDLDSDNDGLIDKDEAGADPNNPLDTDGDGIFDFRELDSDNDELPDNEEGLTDSKIPNIWIPEGISPNGDGINDILYIKGLANYKNSSVTIFNRWGQVMYESGNGYNNANGFDGHYKGNGRILMSTGEPLPENIYFIIFKSNDNRNLVIQQNIYIKAN